MLHISFGLTAYILCITFLLRQLRSCFGGAGPGASVLLAFFKGQMPLLRRKGSGRVLFHRAACGNRLLHGGLSL